MRITDGKIQITEVLLFPWQDCRPLRLDVGTDTVIQVLLTLRILFVVTVRTTSSLRSAYFVACLNLLGGQQVSIQINILVNKEIILLFGQAPYGFVWRYALGYPLFDLASEYLHQFGFCSLSAWLTRFLSPHFLYLL